MKMTYLIPVILLSSLCGGAVGAISMYEILLHRTVDVVRARRLQIVDANGATKATLATEQNGSVYLRFLASDNRESIFLGEPGQVAQSDTGASPEQVLEFSKDGHAALRLSTDSRSNGIIAFSDSKRENTMLLGYFPFPADLTTGEPKYEWGMHIRREHGETGIGIVDSPGLPVEYVSPVPHAKP
jgi:hypothetical protein